MLKIGADVYTTDGRAGMLLQVVLDPATGNETHLIVARGFLHKPDRVVPYSTVVRATDYRIRLSLTSAELELCPQHGGNPFMAEGMKIYDRADHLIGTVQLVYPGGASDEAVQRAQRATAAVEHLQTAEAAAPHPATFAGTHLSPEMVERMMRHGYLRIAGPGISGAHCYVLPEQILGVIGNRIQLYTTRAELLGAGT